MYRKRIICIGNGLAAMNLALYLDEDTELFIVGTATIAGTNSYLAKGGIAIPLDEADIQKHINDTLIAGDGLCNKTAVEGIIGKAPGLITRLGRLGVVFDKSISLEGGHSKARIRHLSDETGKHLITQLYEKVLGKPNIRLLTPYDAVELFMHDNRCKGVYISPKGTNTLELITADAVVLATGGCGNLFLHHTNTGNANGEGYAMAYKAGATMRNMEFMQFHPTKFYTTTSAENVLITEAFRGAGAVIRNATGDDIMQPVHKLGSLAPRDIVSRTMYEQMRTTHQPHLWLDYKDVNPYLMQESFPAVQHLCYENGLHHTRHIPVSPAAHYMCGGIETDLTGQTSVPNLFAVGEVACTGLHGANRLASNSLLELFIVSEQMATCMNVMKPEILHTRLSVEYPSINHEDKANQMTTALQQIMWNHFGIVRHPESMKEGLYHLKCLQEQLYSTKSAVSGIRLKRVQNSILTATLIAEAASARKESKGCHYIDYAKSTGSVDPAACAIHRTLSNHLL